MYINTVVFRPETTDQLHITPHVVFITFLVVTSCQRIVTMHSLHSESVEVTEVPSVVIQPLGLKPDGTGSQTGCQPLFQVDPQASGHWESATFQVPIMTRPTWQLCSRVKCDAVWLLFS